MTPEQLTMLCNLARAGLGANAHAAPTESLMEAASAIAAGETYVVVLRHHEKQGQTKGGQT